MARILHVYPRCRSPSDRRLALLNFFLLIPKFPGPHRQLFQYILAAFHLSSSVASELWIASHSRSSASSAALTRTPVTARWWAPQSALRWPLSWRYVFTCYTQVLTSTHTSTSSQATSRLRCRYPTAQFCSCWRFPASLDSYRQYKLASKPWRERFLRAHLACHILLSHFFLAILRCTAQFFNTQTIPCSVFLLQGISPALPSAPCPSQPLGRKSVPRNFCENAKEIYIPRAASCLPVHVEQGRGRWG